jgi:two-component system, OmpR family, phosphate regulon sensor histidine kinase PhoR
MRLKAIPLLIVAMALALLGIVVIQYLWIRKSIDEKQALVDNKVIQAVTNVDIQLSDVHALAFFSDTGHFDFQLHDSLMFLHETDSIVEMHRFLPIKEQRDIEIQVLSGFKQDRKDCMMHEHQQLHQRMIEMDSVTVELHNLEDELLRLNEVRSVFNKIQVEVNPFLADSRLDSARIAALLDQELGSFGLGKAANWAVYDGLDKTYEIMPLKEAQFDYTIPLFKNDLVHPRRYNLQLTISDASQLVGVDIRWMIILSVLFILVITGAFIFAIRLVIKHKKISQIKSDFINNMTHEFKTPLASISLAADSIIHPHIIGDKTRIGEYISIIQQEKTKLNQNVERILEVAALEKGKFELADEGVIIDASLENAIKSVELLLREKKGSVHTQIETGMLAKGSAFHFQNAVANIIENSIKYCIQTPAIKIALSKQENFALLTISDNGIGLTEKQLAHVFDNFYRVESGNIHTTKGFGLGLTYAKLIIEKMNGTIHIESRLQKGTTVAIKLPLL